MRSTPGVYVLVMHLPSATSVKAGKLGTIHLEPGYYLYCGSAQGGLGPRLARHMRPDKVPHWHVDALTTVAEPVGALLFSGQKKEECRLGRCLSECPGVSMVQKGFGSSDCSCRSHLFHVPEEVPLVIVLDILRAAFL